MEGDTLIYYNGVEEKLNDEFFSSRKELYILDSNSNVYSGSQVQIDGASLSNNADYLNWSEGYLMVPYVFTATTSEANFGGAGARPDFIACLKNGSHQIINNMSVEINGKSMLNLTPYLNEFVSFKLLSSFSQDDLNDWGDLLTFYPDTSRAVSYNAATTGLKNNFGTDVVAENVDINGANIASTTNVGLVKRSMSLAYNRASSGLSGLFSADNSATRNVARSYADLGSANTMVYYLTAIIRLKDLSDLFAKLDFPCKGLYIKLNFQVNQGTQVLTGAAAATNYTITGTSVSSSTFPIMYNENAFTIADGETLTLECAVSKVGNFSHPLQGCRLYVPSYKMKPEMEVKYLEKAMIKEVVYEDIQEFSVPSFTSEVNTILSNGMINPTKLVVVPHIAPSSNANRSPLISSTSCEPACPSPVPLSNWNILVAGQSLYNITESYDFQLFRRALRDAYSVNGCLTDGVSSGLISYKDWEQLYRYYVFDLSRRPSETKDVPLSVQIQCKTETNAISVELHAFITYLRSFKVNLSTGQIL